MRETILVAAVPVVLGTLMIERWRRRAVRAYEASQRRIRRRDELFGAAEGEFDPERDLHR
jgi:hypothetical protein